MIKVVCLKVTRIHSFFHGYYNIQLSSLVYVGFNFSVRFYHSKLKTVLKAYSSQYFENISIVLGAKNIIENKTENKNLLSHILEGEAV